MLEYGINEAEVLEASPHRLTQLLMERAVQLIHNAKECVKKNDVKRKGEMIGKATDIVSYLRLTLNMDHPEAKKISVKLDEVYQFINQQLLEANIHNDEAYLDSALQKLLIVKSGWDAIAP